MEGVDSSFFITRGQKRYFLKAEITDKSKHGFHLENVFRPKYVFLFCY
jgi:hypothetical protein